MINLGRIAILSAALMALGMLGAQASPAAEFHCSAEPCWPITKTDGSGKTAHHVIVIKQGAASAAITCSTFKAEGELPFKTFSSLRLRNLAYSTCTLAGSAATVSVNGCEYELTASGLFSIVCPSGKAITISTGACQVKIGSQSFLSTASFTNLSFKKEITFGLAVKKIVASASGCEPLGLPTATYFESEYTTGNTIIWGTFGESIWWE